MIKQCDNCGRTDGRFSGALCAACHQFKRRTGRDRPYRGDGRKIATVRGEQHYAWKGDGAGRNTKRARARRIYDLGPCERCGKPATDRHHKDDDTGNNATDNIAILCRRCHMEADGRLAEFIANQKRLAARPLKPSSPCGHCGRPYKPLRKGLCAACNQYQMVHGEPRPLNGKFKKRSNSSGGNAGKTHCVHGHEFTPANTYVGKDSKRSCRACDAERARKRRMAKALIAGKTGGEYEAK